MKIFNHPGNYRFLGDPAKMIRELHAKLAGQNNGNDQLCPSYGDLITRLSLIFALEKM